MAGLVDRLAAKLGPGPHRDLNVLMESITEDAKQRGIKLTAKRKEAVPRLAGRTLRRSPTGCGKEVQAGEGET